MKQKEEKKKSIRKNNFFPNPDEDNGSETGTSLGKFPHYIPNLKLYQWTLTLFINSGRAYSKQTAFESAQEEYPQI
jgi:hypothetical protein